MAGRASLIWPCSSAAQPSTRRKSGLRKCKAAVRNRTPFGKAFQLSAVGFGPGFLHPVAWCHRLPRPLLRHGHSDHPSCNYPTTFDWPLAYGFLEKSDVLAFEELLKSIPALKSELIQKIQNQEAQQSLFK